MYFEVSLYVTVGDYSLEKLLQKYRENVMWLVVVSFSAQNQLWERDIHLFLECHPLSLPRSAIVRVNTLLPRQHVFALMCQTLSKPGCRLHGCPCLCLSKLVTLQHIQIITHERAATTVSIVIRHIVAPILWHSFPVGSYGEVSLATVAAATVPITAFRSRMQMRGRRQNRTPFTRT